MTEPRERRFKVILKMKKPWVLDSKWAREPTLNRMLEAFADEVLSGTLDDYFEIVIEEV